MSLSQLEPPPIFEFLRRRGEFTFEDMERTFNLGAGMLIIGTPEAMKKAVNLHADLKKLGHITGDSEIVVSP